MVCWSGYITKKLGMKGGRAAQRQAKRGEPSEAGLEHPRCLFPSLVIDWLRRSLNFSLAISHRKGQCLTGSLIHSLTHSHSQSPYSLTYTVTHTRPLTFPNMPKFSSSVKLVLHACFEWALIAGGEWVLIAGGDWVLIAGGECLRRGRGKIMSASGGTGVRQGGWRQE